jgi:DNA repair protein RecO (recombination protein O)
MNQRNYKATGINLKALPMGESDRLVTVLTKEFGLVRAVAPGARKHKSRLGGRSGLFVVNDLMFSRGKSLDKLIQAETQQSFAGLSKDLAKLTASQYLAEIALAQALTEQPQEELYCLLIEHLGRLEAASQRQILPCLAQAIFHLLALAGVAPDVFRCCLSRSPIQPEWGNPDWRVGFSLASGGAVDLAAVKEIECDRFKEIEHIERDWLAHRQANAAQPIQESGTQESGTQESGTQESGTGRLTVQEAAATYSDGPRPERPISITSTSGVSTSGVSTSGDTQTAPVQTTQARAIAQWQAKVQAKVAKEVRQNLGIVGYVTASELTLMQQLSQPALNLATPAASATEQLGTEQLGSPLGSRSGTIGISETVAESGLDEDSLLKWRHIEFFLRQYAQYQFDRPIRSAALIDTCFNLSTHAARA